MEALQNWMINGPKTFIEGFTFFHLLTIVGVLLTIFIIRWVLVVIFMKWLEKKSEKTETELDDYIVDAIKPPIGWIIVTVGIFLAYLFLFQNSIGYYDTNVFIKVIPEDVGNIIFNIFFSLMVLCLSWLLWRLTNNLSKYFAKKAEETDTKLDDQIVPIARKISKVIILCITLGVIMSTFGVDVTGIIAGLGVFGFAFAIAAQDTLGNMFGSATLFGSKPFQIGDFIKYGDVEGIVEEIGIRTTKIRKFDRHSVIVPNIHLAKGIVENVSARGNMYRVREKIGVTYNASPGQIEQLVEAIRELIENHEKTNKDAISVYFINYGDSALEILMQFFFEVEGFPNYLTEKHKFLLTVMKLVDSIGLEFAFPSMTLYKYDANLEKDSENNREKFAKYLRKRREQKRREELKKKNREDMTEEEKEEELKEDLKDKEEHIHDLKSKLKKEEELAEELKKELYGEEEKSDDEKKVEEGLAQGGHIEEDE